jgi:glycosyltransferase involved in cell wall biosynthesis
MKVDAHYLAISESVYQDLETKYPKTTASQYPHPYYDHYGDSIDKTDASQLLDLPSQRDYLLFFGLVRSYKGLSQLLTAFAQIASSHPNLDLIVAGEFYESVEIYRRIIANDKLEHRVIVRDHFVPDKLVAAYFSISDLVMLPYISATQSGVGQIATHFDKPILVTNVGSLAQMANNGKTGIVVNCSGESIAQGINKFYEENLGKSLTDNIHSLKNDISWSGLYDHICKVVNLNL